MNVLEEIAESTTAQENTLLLPCGLLGLEHIKRFVLITNPDEEPFSWLQVMDQDDLAFLVVPAFAAFPNYSPDIPAEDAAFLELYRPEDAVIYNIVTLRSSGPSTANLKGPIVLNKVTLRAKQVIISNAADYSVQEPLPVLS
jgi:flagellar assembly factor FliW